MHISIPDDKWNDERLAWLEEHISPADPSDRHPWDRQGPGWSVTREFYPSRMTFGGTWWYVVRIYDPKLFTMFVLRWSGSND